MANFFSPFRLAIHFDVVLTCDIMCLLSIRDWHFVIVLSLKFFRLTISTHTRSLVMSYNLMRWEKGGINPRGYISHLHFPQWGEEKENLFFISWGQNTKIIWVRWRETFLCASLFVSRQWSSTQEHLSALGWVCKVIYFLLHVPLESLI